MPIELWLGILGTILALIPIFSYLVLRFYYNPRVFLTVGGQQSGTPIPLPSSNDKMYIGIGTKSSKEILIKEVLVQYRSQDAEIVSNEGSQTLTLDQDFPVALHFSGSWIIKSKHSKLFMAGYKVKEGIHQFQIKIVVYAKVDESEISFPWDMIPPKIHKQEFILQFKVEDFKGSLDEKLKKYGYPLGPREGIMSGYTIERKT
jgi:hypothetical protein